MDVDIHIKPSQMKRYITMLRVYHLMLMLFVAMIIAVSIALWLMPSNLQGPPGEQGIQGEIGETGATGAKGAKGSEGDAGPKGDKGTEGAGFWGKAK